MLKLFLANALKSPGRLLALCVVIYIASHSFFVGLFVVGLVIAAIRSEIRKKVKAAEAQQAEAKQAEAEQLRSDLAKAQSEKTEIPAEPVKPAPAREYAKSAVVIPFRTGTRN